MATDVNKSVINGDFYNDRPISERNHLSEPINTSAHNPLTCPVCRVRTGPSTKPTEFQQYLNTHPLPQSEKAYLDGVPNKAETYDEGKEPLAWLPWAAIDELSKAQVYGHGKYKDFNNYRKGMEVSRNLSCALRHIRDYLSGSDRDIESGLNPLAHAICRIAFVLQNIHDGVEIDDRYNL